MRPRILIFEDNQILREMFWLFLDKKGCEVFAFFKPKAFNCHLNRECMCPQNETCADIIISDYSMPETTGTELIQELLRKRCKIKHYAILSGTWSTMQRQDAKALRCKLFWKPIPLGDISAWMDTCVRQLDPNRTLYDPFFIEPSRTTPGKPGKLKI